jgi:hypothetical protein
MPRTLLLAALTLPAGFAVAELTDVRAIGGVVMVALAAATLATASASAGAGRSAAWLLVLAVAFALSHVIADALTAWGAVALVTAVVTAAAAALLER